MSPRFTSMRGRLLSIVMITALAALIVMLIGNLLGTAWRVHQRQVRNLSTEAEMIGRMIVPALNFDDPELAEQNLALFQARSKMRAAALFDAAGQLFANYRAADHAGALPAVAENDSAGLDGTDLVVFRRIEQNGALLGTIYLREQSGIGLALKQSAIIAGIAGLLALGLAFLLIRRLERVVMQPISAVASVAREVIRQRDYSRRVDKTDADPVGELVDAFNDMLAEVERQTAQLQDSYRDLQREADERRLAQLQVQQLNEDLEQRVRERTLALEQTNQELSRAIAAADEASRAKSEFLATMSHEIRTPMNGVIGMLDVLHQSSLRGDQVEMVELIRESALTLLGVIDDTLDFSKIEAGRMELEHAPLSLTAVVESACGMLDHLASKRQVELRLFIDPAIPEPLMGDALRLRQIIINLVNNAIKFSANLKRPGRVAVRAALLAADAQQATVRIDIIDNGIGINQETAARLFTAFSQADTSTTRRFGGTGLGLAISRQLVDLMGGSLSLQSAPEQGSTFSLQLDLPRAADDAAGDATGASSELQDLRCLVIGGGDSLAADLAAYLAADGAQVERVDDWDYALARREPQNPPRIWIIDRSRTPLPSDWSQLLQHPGNDPANLLLVGRGSTRAPQVLEHGAVALDGNVLTRRRLRHAVTMAAHLLGEAAEPGESERPRVRGVARSREEALRLGQLILVAEDNETNQRVIEQQLSLLGHVGDVVENGALALQRWRTGDYALLITDLHMPELDGYALTEAIRAEEADSDRHTPILAFTANALKGAAQRCLDVGMDGYVAKPVRLASLREALEKWLPPAVDVDGTSAVQAGAALDIRVLEQLVGGEQRFIDTLLHEFRINAERDAQLLRAACRDNARPRVVELAHRFKSAAHTVGAMRLSEISARLEETADDAEADIAPLARDFERAMFDVLRYLDATGHH